MWRRRARGSEDQIESDPPPVPEGETSIYKNQWCELEGRPAHHHLPQVTLPTEVFIRLVLIIGSPDGGSFRPLFRQPCGEAGSRRSFRSTESLER